MIHIVGEGTSIITALQPGNTTYKSAENVSQTLSVINGCDAEITMRLIISENPVTANAVVEMYLTDSITLQPRLLDDGISTVGTNGTWTWTGPNSYTATGRIVTLHPSSAADFGTYIVVYEEGECMYVE